MKIECIDDQDLECRECGAVGKPRVLLWLTHQCGHCVPLCLACFEQLLAAMLEWMKKG